MLTFLAFDAPAAWGEHVGIKDAIIGTVIGLLLVIVFIYFWYRDYRKAVAKRTKPDIITRTDRYTGPNPPPASEVIHEYILTTVDEAAREFRPKCKFSPDDVYYKLGKRYPRTLIKKVLLQLADDGQLEEVPTRKGTCFIRS